MKYRFLGLIFILCSLFSCSDLFNGLFGGTALASSLVSGELQMSARMNISTGALDISFDSLPVTTVPVLSQEDLDSLVETLPVAKIKKIEISTPTMTDTPNFLVIGPNAFVNFTYVEEILLPDCVSAIGDYAFSDLTKIKSFIVPKNVTTLGGNAFLGWTDKQSIYLQTNGYDYINFSGIYKTKAKVYQKDGIQIDTDLIFFTYNTGSESGDSVTCYITDEELLTLDGKGENENSDCIRHVCIDSSSSDSTGFDLFSRVTEVKVLGSLSSIPKSLFSSMESLKTFRWLESASDATFGANVFGTYTNIEEFYLPSGLTKIDPSFSECTADQSIYFNMSNTEYKEKSFGTTSFGSAKIFVYENGKYSPSY